MTDFREKAVQREIVKPNPTVKKDASIPLQAQFEAHKLHAKARRRLTFNPPKT
jgi:hypothetical protein